MMLTEAAALRAAPRNRRLVPAEAAGSSRILFGIASPILPALENQWPSWLAPLAGGWKASARGAASPRRSNSP